MEQYNERNMEAIVNIEKYKFLMSGGVCDAIFTTANGIRL